MQARILELAHREMAHIAANPRGLGLTGAVGDALFACALGRIDPEVIAEPILSRALDREAAHWEHDSLHHGVAGLGLVLASYAPHAPELAEIDARCAARVHELPPASVQGGVAGIALYASLRSGAESGRRLQKACLDALAATALPWGDGIVWATPEWYVRARGVDVRGAPITELGPVHGVAGAVVALAALACAGHEGRQTASELVRAALRAIWASERPGPNRFGRIAFGAYGGDDTLELEDQRWCIGDRGVLRSCWVAARAVGDGESQARALDGLRALATMDLTGPLPGAKGRIDLCCGAAVIAQVYGRMFRETGEPVFQAAQARLLAPCAEGVEGLRVRGFAYGRPGILLALLAQDSSADPTWDGILGLCLPRAEGSQRRSLHAEVAA